MDCKHVEPLVSGYLDRELTQQESQQVRIHLETCDSCQALYSDLRQLKEKTGGLDWPLADTAQLAAMENDLFSRGAQASGWLLMALGALLLVAFTVYDYLSAPDVPGILKLCLVAFHLGLAVLFVMVLRQRLMTYRNDKYMNVKL